MEECDVKDVGQGKTHSEVVNKYDAEHGSYQDETTVKKVESPKPAVATHQPIQIKGG